MDRFILECVKYEKGTMGKETPNRKMIGPTIFNRAHWAMGQLKDKYDDIIIHQIYSLDDELLIVKTGTLKTKGETDDFE